MLQSSIINQQSAITITKRSTWAGRPLTSRLSWRLVVGVQRRNGASKFDFVVFLAQAAQRTQHHRDSVVTIRLRKDASTRMRRKASKSTGADLNMICLAQLLTKRGAHRQSAAERNAQAREQTPRRDSRSLQSFNRRRVNATGAEQRAKHCDGVRVCYTNVSVLQSLRNWQPHLGNRPSAQHRVTTLRSHKQFTFPRRFCGLLR